MNVNTSHSRSALMARVKGKNTGPEILVRKRLHSLGARFRLHQKKLPGSPDVVLASRKLVIFVHGCFWHRHSGCKRTTTPKTRTEFWEGKFAANLLRDKRNIECLENQGWSVQVIWECETRNDADLTKRLQRMLDDHSMSGSLGSEGCQKDSTRCQNHANCSECST